MASSGRISVLVSPALRTLLSAVRELPAEVNKQNRAATKAAAAPLWSEAVRGHVGTRRQTRVLSDTARVGVSDTNVMLRSASAGTLSDGTPVSLLAAGDEFGANPNGTITSRTKAGKAYTRRRGGQFPAPRAGGHVVYPAARDSIPRFARLWVQTVLRTVHETFEKGGAK